MLIDIYFFLCALCALCGEKAAQSYFSRASAAFQSMFLKNEAM
jgi:hypothetical protein